MDSIRENLDRLGDLSPEELTALQEKIVAEFGTLSDSVGDSPTRETVDAMNELADANDFVVQESDRRVAEAAELSAAAEDAISRMNAGDPAAEDGAAPEDVPVDEALAEKPPVEGSPEEEDSETPEE